MATKTVATVVAVTVALAVCVPLVISLSRALVVPAIVGVGLYLAVRLVHARIDR